MSLGVNNQTVIQNYQNPQMNTTFKANPIVTTNTLERTPSADTLVKPAKNKTKKTLLTLGAITLAGVGIFAALKTGKAHQQKKAIQEIEKKFADLQGDMPKVQKTFKEVFLRDDITEKEALDMLNRYKEVEKLGITGTKEEYIKALFKEVKQNYGYKDTPIQLLIEVPPRKTLGGECSRLNHSIMINPKYNNSNIFNTMHHEFRHAKQHELAYNTDPTITDIAFLKAVKKVSPDELDKATDHIIDKGIEREQEIQAKLIEHFSFLHEKMVTRYLGKSSINNIPKSQQELAQKLTKSFKECNYEEYGKYGEYYKTRFFEEDARFAGESIAKLFGLR